MYTVSALRKEFSDFFANNGHEHVSSSSLVAAGDETLLFANSGMVQFKEVFSGKEKRSYRRAVTIQKCMRVAGKHNDLDAIGRTRRHHTFFEMAGNFSFGDYFKADAIKLAWSFLTETIGLDQNKLWISVHQGDNEAYNLWLSLGAFDSDKIVKLGDKTNLWSMGPVGPWGYCSEIFYYIGDGTPTAEGIVDEDPNYLEIWNLVFMQYYRDEEGNDTDLPMQSIDTGMGLERLASVVQGKRSNYDTDELRQIIDFISQLCGKEYIGIEYEDNEKSQQFLVDMSIRVLADHVRAAVFLMSEGLRPGNREEAYVLRRLLRRAIRYASNLGLESAAPSVTKEIKEILEVSFLAKIGNKIIEVMGESYPDLNRGAINILSGLKEEEERFGLTLNVGMNLLNGFIKDQKEGFCLGADKLFKLYDTFGFPLDVAKDVLAEKGMDVDEEGFGDLMKKQQQRSKNLVSIKDSSDIDVSEIKLNKSVFLGYDTLEHTTNKFWIIELGEKQGIVADATPFYVEKGGQISDIGTIVTQGIEIPVERVIEVNNLVIHVVDCNIVKEATCITLKVDYNRRQQTAVHHSLTHIVNCALRNVLGEHVIQKGSLVTDTYARFDFSHPSQVTEDEVVKVQSAVNRIIASTVAITTLEMSIDNAIAAGAVATFGEKYGEVVRVVSIGDYRELCGGTHVKNTGQIGTAIILQESGISAGIRRLTFVGGESATDYLNQVYLQNCELKDVLKVQPNEFLCAVNGLLAKTNSLKSELSQTTLALATLEAQLVVAKRQIVSEIGAYIQIYPDQSKEISLAIADRILVEDKEAKFVVVASESTKSLVVVAHDGANKIVDILKSKIGGKGGGKSSSAFLGNLQSIQREEIINALK